MAEKIWKSIRVRMILQADVPVQKENLSPVQIIDDALRSHIAMDIETDPE